MTTEAPMSAAEKALMTTARRGGTLLSEERYTVEPVPARPGVFCVARPADDPRPLRPGCSLWNEVDTNEQTCTCAGFQYRGVCPHLIAVNQAVAEARRLLGVTR